MEFNDHMLGTNELGHHNSSAVIDIIACDNLETILCWTMRQNNIIYSVHCNV